MPNATLTELGISGLNRQSGHVYEEFLRELQGPRWRRTIREMSEQDAVIHAILFAIKMLIRQAEWKFEGTDDSEPAMEMADWYTGCLHDMSFSWADTLSEIVSFLPWGWAYLELVYKLRDGDVADPTRRSNFSDSKLGWRKWAIRSQDTLDEWEFDDDGGIKGLWQCAPPIYAKTFIPIEKSLLFRTEARKGNPEGVSIIRGAYVSWYYKKNISRVEAIGVERDLAGLPYAQVPPELLSPSATADQQAVLAAVKNIVTGVKNDEQAGVIFPLAYDESGKELYKFSLLSTGGTRTFDTDKIINRYDQRMALSVLAQFILLGSEKVGSFALSESQSDLFSTALGAWLDSIADVVNTHAVPRLHKLNAFDPALMPRLKATRPAKVDLQALGDFISKLSGSGMPLFPDENLESHIRSQVKWPEKSDELREIEEENREMAKQRMEAVNRSEGEDSETEDK